MSDERRLLEAAAWLRNCTPAEREAAAFYADLESYQARSEKAEADLAAFVKILDPDDRNTVGAMVALQRLQADLARAVEERDALASQLADLQREHDKLQAHADDLYRQASERAKERDAALKRVDKLVTISKIGRGLLGGER